MHILLRFRRLLFVWGCHCTKSQPGRFPGQEDSPDGLSKFQWGVGKRIGAINLNLYDKSYCLPGWIISFYEGDVIEKSVKWPTSKNSRLLVLFYIFPYREIRSWCVIKVGHYRWREVWGVHCLLSDSRGPHHHLSRSHHQAADSHRTSRRKSFWSQEYDHFYYNVFIL